MNGKKYDVAKGMWNPAVKRWIYPGEEILVGVPPPPPARTVPEHADRRSVGLL